MALEAVNTTDKFNKNENIFSNLDAEIAIIGCILWDNRNYEKISDFLHEDHFVDENNKHIYKIIKNLLEKNILVSPITLKNYLPDDDNKIDNIKYLNQIKDSAPSTQNTYNYAKIIYDLHIKRNLIGIAHNIIQETKFSSIDKKEPSNVISDNKQERIIKKAKKNKLYNKGIKEKLKSKNGLREAFILKEILDKKY